MKDSQEGFTLLEVLLSIAVGGMIMGGIVTAIFQTLRIPANSNVTITALENINNIAPWISEDVRMAGTTNLIDGAPPVNSLVLDWVRWSDSGGQVASAAHHSQYQLVGDKLQRTYYYATAPSTTRNVGSYISAIKFARQGQMIYATITSSISGTSGTVESKTYRIYLQPKEELVR